MKRALLAPRTAYLRRREPADLPAFARSMRELHYFSRPMRAMLRAVEAKPNLMYDVELDHGGVVFDVGAHHGDWCSVIAARYAPTLYAFEPDPMSSPRLRAALAVHPKATALRYGLGAASATAHLTLAGPGSSLYGAGASFGTRAVEIRDVVAVLETLAPTGVDLMKVNIEGGEYDLLDRVIAGGWLPRVRQLLVQFHEWHPKAYRRRRAIRRALARTHHEVWGYAWLWELWRRLPDA